MECYTYISRGMSLNCGDAALEMDKVSEGKLVKETVAVSDKIMVEFIDGLEVNKHE
jgi:hypothetical protein